MFENIFDVVMRAVKEWIPKKRYSSEAGYRNDLYEFLRKKLNGKEEENFFALGSSKTYTVRTEFGSARADIAVINSEKIGIELKYNFDTKRKRITLVGQVVNDYFKEYSYVIIVLCGHVDTENFDVLQHDLKKYEPSNFSLGQQEKVVKIVSKSKVGYKKPKKKPKTTKKKTASRKATKPKKITRKKTKPRTTKTRKKKTSKTKRRKR